MIQKSLKEKIVEVKSKPVSARTKEEKEKKVDKGWDGKRLTFLIHGKKQT
jgi:hypothetical protein